FWRAKRTFNDAGSRRRRSRMTDPERTYAGSNFAMQYVLRSCTMVCGLSRAARQALRVAGRPRMKLGGRLISIFNLPVARRSTRPVARSPAGPYEVETIEWSIEAPSDKRT